MKYFNLLWEVVGKHSLIHSFKNILSNGLKFIKIIKSRKRIIKYDLGPTKLKKKNIC